MKKLFFALLLVSGFFLQKADAQVRVGVNFNVGAQPDWGPYGYDYAQFYYFPDIDVYYDVMNQEFVYFDGFDWRYSPYLSQRYSNYDLYSAYKVVINEPRPYLRDNYYRRRYYGYQNYHNQPVLRDYRHDGFDNRRDERFEQRNESYEQRDERFEHERRMERSNRNDERWGSRDFNHNNNRNAEQRNDRNFGQRENRDVQQNNNRDFEQRGNENQGMYGRSGADQRNDDHDFRRRN
ncbi:MAG TPA: hypothetical protein VFS22_06510 [Flavisolibacter sp.]|nr:hypothetical protein [Flavisolibacter sp.]